MTTSHFRFKAVLVLLFACSGAIAEPRPMPPPNQQGELGLIIVASESPVYIQEWLTTPPNHGVIIKRLHTAKPEQLIVTSFLVHGLASNQSRQYSFRVSFYVLDPDGKPIFGVRDYAKGKGTIPKNPSFIMADPALDIVLEDSDPPGTYTIAAQVVDTNNGKKADASYKIDFIKNAL